MGRMDDYDSRQYRLMLDLLNEFDARSVGLRKVITDLEALLGSLKNADTEWKSSFYSHWAILEDVYADALDKGWTQLPSARQAMVEGAASSLRRLVEQITRS